jgi:hypothetical protein
VELLAKIRPQLLRRTEGGIPLKRLQNWQWVYQTDKSDTWFQAKHLKLSISFLLLLRSNTAEAETNKRGDFSSKSSCMMFYLQQGYANSGQVGS